jgi:hypothetical protein
VNPLQFVGEAAKLIGKLPPEVIEALAGVVKAVAASKDPARAARLAALAAASKAGTEAAIEAALAKSVKRK